MSGGSDQFESTCNDYTMKDGRIVKGCGEQILMVKTPLINPATGKNKWMAYTVRGTEFIEHKNVCAARAQKTFTQSQDEQQHREQISAHGNRSSEILAHDRIIEMAHDIGVLKKSAASIINLLLPIAKKLDVVPDEEAAEDE